MTNWLLSITSSYWASCQGIYLYRGRLPPKLQSLPSEEKDDVNPPTGNPNWHGGTLQCLQAELGDLADRELQQLVEDIWWEIALCELHAPPSNPQPTPWGQPSGSRTFNEDDQEVTVTICFGFFILLYCFHCRTRSCKGWIITQDKLVYTL